MLRTEGEGPISTMKSASRSTAIGPVAEPHTTGKTVALATPMAMVSSSSRDGGDVAVQVALEQLVVGDHDAFDEVVVHLVLTLLHLVGDLAYLALAGVVDVRLVGEQVGDSVERCLLADGQLERGDACAEPIPELFERAVERGAFLVELVDEDHAGDAQLPGESPDPLGADLDSVDGVHHEHGEIDHAQGGVDVANEVGVARRVDEVDLVALPLERGVGQGERHPALGLLGVEVEHGVAIFDPAQTADGPSPVEQRLCQRRLPRPAVSHKRNIANLLGRVDLHVSASKCFVIETGRLVRVMQARIGAG